MRALLVLSMLALPGCYATGTQKTLTVEFMDGVPSERGGDVQVCAFIMGSFTCVSAREYARQLAERRAPKAQGL